jgi:hypothetical protein
MSRRKLGVDSSGRAGLQLHFDFSDVHLELSAMTHEIERQRTITQLLVEIYMMTAFGILEKTDKLFVQGAAVQDERAGGGHQAAHYLPRQLLVNAGRLQDVGAAVSLRLGKHITALFARTEKLPANYNRADSKAEMEGLDLAFLDACRETIISASTISSTTENHEILTSAPSFIKSAICFYQDRAAIAFVLAIKKLNEKLKDSWTLAQERERWSEQIAILRGYQKIFGIHQAINEELTSERIEGVVFTYRGIYFK